MIKVYVFDFVTGEISDSEAIDKALCYAKKEKADVLVFDRKDWHLDRAILFYSDLTIVVDGVTLKQNEDVCDNIFRPENFTVDPDNPFGYPLGIEVTRNVKILGLNGAALEGPDQPSKRLNFETGEMQETVGDIWGWRTFIVFVPRCVHFELSGFFIMKTRNWAISAERCENSYFHDLQFLTSCVNGDGLNLRNGCHHIKIENIAGTTTDDLIALNNGSVFEPHPFKSWKTYLYPLVPSNYLMPIEAPGDGDIHHIDIRNVRLKPVRFVQAVALLARNGNKISIDRSGQILFFRDVLDADIVNLIAVSCQ